eukprot:g42307.t1
MSLSILNAVPSFVLPAQRSWMVTTHMHNHVPVADVLTFLGRYVKMESGNSDVMDPFRIWNSKRQVKGALRADTDGNILHPPSNFVIGWSRGYPNESGARGPQQLNGRPSCTMVTSSSSSDEGDLRRECHQHKRRIKTTMEKERSNPQPKNMAGVWDTAPQQLKEMVELWTPGPLICYRGNDCCSSGLGILLRGGNFTISEVTEVMGGCVLIADVMNRNTALRLITMDTLAVKSERLAVLQQLPLLKCYTCPYIYPPTPTSIQVPKQTFHIKQVFTCTFINLVYGIRCSRCGLLYIGSLMTNKTDYKKTRAPEMLTAMCNEPLTI